MKKHFVTFQSPGTFIAESSTEEIDSWDIKKAIKISKTIKERHGATPYGFYFTTRERKEDELDSKVVATSPMHYINCKVLTIEEVKARKDPKDRILISNMECNGYDKIVVTTKGWKWTQPLDKEDIVIY